MDYSKAGYPKPGISYTPNLVCDPRLLVGVKIETKEELVMGYGDCGDDTQGRPIGYNFIATCDHPGCDSEINRGFSYACGGNHGIEEYGCEKYFCEKHLYVIEIPDKINGSPEWPSSRTISVCRQCRDTILASDKAIHDLNKS